MYENNSNYNDFSGEQTHFDSGEKNKTVEKRQKTLRNLKLALIFGTTIVLVSVLTAAISYITFFTLYAPSQDIDPKDKDLSNQGIPVSGSQDDTSQDPLSQASPTPMPTLPPYDPGEVSIPKVNLQVSPSVVYINTVAGRTTGAGSGVIYTEDGYIITNNHVVEFASKVVVKLNDQREYEAKIIGTDAGTDLALLKIEAKNLTPARLGNSDHITVGEPAIAIGNPLGTLEGTVTAGIVSAIDRLIEIDGFYMTLIQTDAALNPGNSGGALANIRGEVIGIVNAKTVAGEVEGLGYAIPVNTAKNIVDQLKKDGYVKKPFIGVEFDFMATETILYGVMANLPDAKAGLKVGDKIVRINDQKIALISDIQLILNNSKVGDTLTVRVLRDGREISLTLVLGERPS